MQGIYILPQFHRFDLVAEIVERAKGQTGKMPAVGYGVS